MSKRIDRNSSLELLRIISMLFIVMNHYSGRALEYERCQLSECYKLSTL